MDEMRCSVYQTVTYLIRKMETENLKIYHPRNHVWREKYRKTTSFQSQRYLMGWMQTNGTLFTVSYKIEKVEKYKILFAAIGFFEHINLLYGTVSEFCNLSTCPEMLGPGPR